MICRVLSYQPPSEDLVEALVQLVRYVTVVEDAPRSVGGGAVPAPRSVSSGGVGAVPAAPLPASRPAQSAASSWLPESPVRTSPPLLTPRLTAPLPAGTLLAGPSSSPAVQAMSRKLYRFLR